jgi:hypothetical protein
MYSPDRPGFKHGQYLESCKRNLAKVMAGHYSAERRAKALEDLRRAEESYQASIAEETIAK